MNLTILSGRSRFSARFDPGVDKGEEADDGGKPQFGLWQLAKEQDG